MHLEAIDRWFHPQFDSLKWKGTNEKGICQGKRTEMDGYWNISKDMASL